MNPRDRSALMLDAAIQRRLHRIEVLPSTRALQEMLENRLVGGDLALLSEWFEKHLRILPFGHGVFAQVNSPEDLRDVWSGTIVHLLSDPFGEIREQYEQLAAEYPWKETGTAA